MHSPEEVKRVLELKASGLNNSEIARVTGISRGAVKDWAHGRLPDFEKRHSGPCPGCFIDPATLDQRLFMYLLGLYLGDGTISEMKKNVFRLRIVCCDAYPYLMERCAEAMSAVLPNKVGHVARIGCTEVFSDSKHWRCLFPQAGPGRKHERKIELAPWQQLLLEQDPRPLIEGLIHSDGCRSLNWVGGRPYPRYTFSNISTDIKKIFTDALDALNIQWRVMNARNISVARREEVAKLDAFVERKR